MKEIKAQIRPLLRLKVIYALEIAKNEEKRPLGELLEKFLLESESFKKYYKKLDYNIK
jgi:hypothetical protein